MNLSIIKSFIADQRRAKQIIAEKLGVAEDIRALDWATGYRQIRNAYGASPFAEKFRPHGYGLELRLGDLYIDYDYSVTGRSDGFDSWRIFVYLMAGQFDNGGQDKTISDRIDDWFDALVLGGRIEKLDNLYYLAGNPNSGA